MSSRSALLVSGEGNRFDLYYRGKNCCEYIAELDACEVFGYLRELSDVEGMDLVDYEAVMEDAEEALFQYFHPDEEPEYTENNQVDRPADYRLTEQAESLLEEDLHPDVEAMLEASREREAPDSRLDVDSQPIAESLSGERTEVIAEYKPESPGTDYSAEIDPAEAAIQMVEAGASMVSVLTEDEYFGGSPEDLRKVREAVDVPVLRKDFVLNEEELDRVGADSVLLIARFLDEDQYEDLGYMVEAARERGMEPLVEVHTAEELDYALESGAELIGVNNRDLGELEVDLSTFEELAPEVPDDKTVIAESGIKDAADVESMKNAGADALLIGSSIMQSGDIGSKTSEFVDAGNQQ